MNESLHVSSCASPESPTVFTVQQARDAILNATPRIDGWRKVAIREALNHVLAAPIIAPIDVPTHHNSAMDGYAIHSASLTTPQTPLTMIGTAFAGRPFMGTVHVGECVRIMTGAVLPNGCDSVVMQEQVVIDNQHIICQKSVEPGQNIRFAGEDIQVGQEVLAIGKQLTPADIAVIASLGIAEVTVKPTLKVAFFSTGDELRSIGEVCNLGEIYDSNRYSLYGMLKRLHVDIIDMGIVRDNPDTLRDTLMLAAEQADIVLTSGGVSVGDADYIKTILSDIGQINFWKIAMKPGRPLTHGTIGNTPFFGLPGNPVSAMVTFYQFVKPAIEKRAGQQIESPLQVNAIATQSIRKRSGRFEFQRGILTMESGQLMVSTTGQQGSGILHSMSSANCFILLDEQCNGVAAGDNVIVQPFAGLI